MSDHKDRTEVNCAALYYKTRRYGFHDPPTFCPSSDSIHDVRLCFQTHPSHLTLWSHRHDTMELGHQQPKIFQSIRRRLKNNDCDGELREMLLEG